VATVEVSWGENGTDPNAGTTSVDTAGQLDLLLDLIQARRSPSGLPYLVTITDLNSDGLLHCGLQLGLGHSQRSRLWYVQRSRLWQVGAPAAALGHDPTLLAWTGGLVTWDDLGTPADDDASQLRVTAEQARQAAREFFQTGRRPTVVSWDTRPPRRRGPRQIGARRRPRHRV
jgi:hypothetical protein